MDQTKLFSPDGKTGALDTDPTTQPDEALEEEVENVWANDPKPKETGDEMYHCPFHSRLCSRNICDHIEKHLAKQGLKWRDIKDKGPGPSNIYTIERRECSLSNHSAPRMCQLGLTRSLVIRVCRREEGARG